MADNEREKRFRRGSVTVTVFPHTNAKTGRKFLTAVPSRSYMMDGARKYTDSFSLSHVANLKAALAEAESYMAVEESIRMMKSEGEPAPVE